MMQLHAAHLPLILTLAASAIGCSADSQTSATSAGPTGANDDFGASTSLASCDPLDSDCGPQSNCTLVGESFQCVAIVVDGAAGDACQEETECGLGLACLAAVVVPGCYGFKCCTPLCALDEERFTCPGADIGAVCAPALTGEAPLHGNVGVCRLR